jgi:hypothetical protein
MGINQIRHEPAEINKMIAINMHIISYQKVLTATEQGRAAIVV